MVHGGVPISVPRHWGPLFYRAWRQPGQAQLTLINVIAEAGPEQTSPASGTVSLSRPVTAGRAVFFLRNFMTYSINDTLVLYSLAQYRRLVRTTEYYCLDGGDSSWHGILLSCVLLRLLDIFLAKQLPCLGILSVSGLPVSC